MATINSRHNPDDVEAEVRRLGLLSEDGTYTEAARRTALRSLMQAAATDGPRPEPIYVITQVVQGGRVLSHHTIEIPPQEA